MSHPWILGGEQSGLWTRIAATENVFVVRADEKLTAFVELESAIRIQGRALIAEFDESEFVASVARASDCTGTRFLNAKSLMERAAGPR